MSPESQDSKRSDKVLAVTLMAVRKRRRAQNRQRVIGVITIVSLLGFFAFGRTKQTVRPPNVKLVESLPAEPLKNVHAEPENVSVFHTPSDLKVPLFSSRDTKIVVTPISDAEVIALCAELDGGGIVGGKNARQIVLASALRSSLPVTE